MIDYLKLCAVAGENEMFYKYLFFKEVSKAAALLFSQQIVHSLG